MYSLIHGNTFNVNAVNRVRIIMEKDALKNPLTSRNAANARRLVGQVPPLHTKHMF